MARQPSLRQEGLGCLEGEDSGRSKIVVKLTTLGLLSANGSRRQLECTEFGEPLFSLVYVYAVALAAIWRLRLSLASAKLPQLVQCASLLLLLALHI